MISAMLDYLDRPRKVPAKEILEQALGKLRCRG